MLSYPCDIVTVETRNGNSQALKNSSNIQLVNAKTGFFSQKTTRSSCHWLNCMTRRLVFCLRSYIIIGVRECFDQLLNTIHSPEMEFSSRYR